MSLPPASLCVRCRASQLLCGKERCPILVKVYSRGKTMQLLEGAGKEIHGSTPPGVFVGRYGYPKVNVGPLIPPVLGDTMEMDLPEAWGGKTIDEICDMRFSLVRGKHLTSIHNPEENPDKLVQATRELALARESTDSEAVFKKKPFGAIALSDSVQPFGPSAQIEKLSVSSIKTDQKIEKAYSDRDLLSKDAVLYLYDKELPMTRIQKAFSVGLFGIAKNRKLVPTRWSITAVDDTVGKNLLEETRGFPLLNEFRVYEFERLGDRWEILMMPREWSYELIEAWMPNTLWNQQGSTTEMISSWEHFEGRTKYAEIGGCYYAARLAVNEALHRERRQATVVIMRETHPGQIMPLGVWLVRESVREALKQKPLLFNSLNEALSRAASKLDIPVKNWLRTSEVLKKALFQKRLSDYG